MSLISGFRKRKRINPARRIARLKKKASLKPAKRCNSKALGTANSRIGMIKGSSKNPSVKEPSASSTGPSLIHDAG